MQRKISIFWSPGFIIGLIILLVNDHFLKILFPHWITGKLSDIAGLFIFPIFLAAFVPRFKKNMYGITVLGFIWFKSPLANGFIEFFNQLDLFSISRVIDWTDLLALIILPFSYRYFTNYQGTNFKLHPLPVILVASFAFIATSRARVNVLNNKTYRFDYSLDTLKKKIFLHKNVYNGLRPEWLKRDSLEKVDPVYQHPDSIKIKNDLFDRFLGFTQLRVEDTACSDGFYAQIELSGNDQGSSLKSTYLYHECHDKKDQFKTQIIQIFEEKIIKPLNE